MNYETYPLLISKNFLKEMNNLTKMSIKVYLSLSFLQKKKGGYFKASHKEISINTFADNDCFCIRSDEGQYYKAFKQLEEYQLIKVHRKRTKKGGYSTNRYNVY